MPDYEFLCVSAFLSTEMDARAIKSAMELGVFDALSADGAVFLGAVHAQLGAVHAQLGAVHAQLVLFGVGRDVDFAAGVLAGFVALDPMAKSPPRLDDGTTLVLFAVSFAGFVIGFYLRAGKSN